MRRILLTTLALLIAASSGCAICASPFDKTYSAYGGRWQRDDMQHGRVGSAFYPAGGPVFVEEFPQFEVNDDQQELVPVAYEQEEVVFFDPDPAPSPK